jgi:hypothetical protein
MITDIFLDQDGVLADFASAALAACGASIGHDDIADWHFYVPLGLSADEFWAKIDAVDGFWDGLAPYPEATCLYFGCQDAAPVTILTSPGFHDGCWSAKVRWLRRHVDPTLCGKRVAIYANKAKLAAPGRVLVDDSESNCDGFVAAGGQAILYPRPWNRNRHLTVGRVAFVLAELARLAGHGR